jgi:hypothetical protein
VPCLAIVSPISAACLLAEHVTAGRPGGAQAFQYVHGALRAAGSCESQSHNALILATVCGQSSGLSPPSQYTRQDLIASRKSARSAHTGVLRHVGAAGMHAGGKLVFEFEDVGGQPLDLVKAFAHNLAAGVW